MRTLSEYEVELVGGGGFFASLNNVGIIFDYRAAPGNFFVSNGIGYTGTGWGDFSASFSCCEMSFGPFTLEFEFFKIEFDPNRPPDLSLEASKNNSPLSPAREGLAKAYWSGSAPFLPPD